MSLTSCLSIAQQALSASQTAITVVSNNIANVDNSSYSKLSVELSDVVTYTNSTNTTVQANSLSGVEVSSIKRYSDDYLTSYYQSENSEYNYLSEYSSLATQVENVVNELNDGGISDALSTFYTDVSALSSDPTDASAREAVVSSAENVCSLFNSYSSTLSSIQTSLVGNYKVNGDVENSEISTETDTVNDLLDQIAEVNKNILQTNASGSSSTSLLDTRDELATELSQYVNIDTTINDNGTINVSIGDYGLVSSGTVTGYLNVSTGTADEPAVVSVVDSDGNTLASNINDSITGGTMGAILDICGSSSSSDFTISSVISQLNSLASSFASALNSVQCGNSTTAGALVTTTSTTVVSGTTTYGTTTTYAMCLTTTGTTELTVSTTSMFVNTTTGDTSNIDASNISVNEALVDNYKLLAAANVSSSVYSAGTYTSDTGNSSNVTDLTATRTTTNSSLNNQTFEDYLSTSVSSVGVSVSALNTSTSTQSSVLTSIETQLESETGVNLDDELSDLIKYQRSYEAAARIFSTTNTLLGDLISLGES